MGTQSSRQFAPAPERILICRVWKSWARARRDASVHLSDVTDLNFETALLKGLETADGDSGTVCSDRHKGNFRNPFATRGTAQAET